ncbi:VanZ family protein [Paenibacillus sp. HW567]|uniref:VanZ family protein n=1 Tax=Paenibacillus sp. HW567 TaxID=1034769 RepID=UPI00036C2B4E|nr:VanZ family protein [Paenibacillus sp. HW567]
MKRLSRSLVILLYVVYLYLLIKIILFKLGSGDHLGYMWLQLQEIFANPEILQRRLIFANFIPFVSITGNLKRLSDPHEFINLVGNIALFVPHGIFIRLTVKRSFVRALLYSFALTLALESAQVIFSMGTFDVDDLILNTLGGLIGYGIFMNTSQNVTIQSKS